MGAGFERAVGYATALHAGQERKGSGAPYITHLLGTAEIARGYGASETELMAAVLHDAVEDHPRGGKTAEEIRALFGEEVLSIVMGCSDSSASGARLPSWRARKEAYLAHYASASPSVVLVSGSDKVHNARAILSDVRSEGEKVFERFTAGKAGVLWYYRALVSALKGAGAPAVLAEELDAVVSAIESEAAKWA